jgi:hypothetical protein
VERTRLDKGEKVKQQGFVGESDVGVFEKHRGLG